MQHRTSITDGISYDELVRLPDFYKIYAVAIEKAGMWKKLELLDSLGALNQPLKILDMGGGIGTLGTLLATEFGPFIEYTNVDIDGAALEKSSGTRIKGSYTHLSKLLGEKEFDCVFCLNPEDNSTLSKHTSDNIRRDGQADDFYRTDLASMTEDAAYQIRQLNSYLVLLNAALVVPPGGMFIRGGVIVKDALNGTKYELVRLGFQPCEDEQLPLTMDAGRTMAKYDLQFVDETLSPSQLERVAQTYAQNFRIVTFDKKGKSDKRLICDRIGEASHNISELYSFIELQDRFWS